MQNGDAVRYVVAGRTVFAGILAYIDGSWAGILQASGRIDEVLVSHLRPA